MISQSLQQKLRGPNKRVFKRASRFLSEKVRSIDIINQQGRIQKVFFSLPPLSRFHSDYSKDEFNDTVSRRSVNDKLSSLMRIVPYVMIELYHFNFLSRGFLRTSNYSVFFVFQRIIFLFSLLVNFLIVILPNLDDEIETRASFKSWKFSLMTQGEKTIWILTLAQLFTVFLTALLWF